MANRDNPGSVEMLSKELKMVALEIGVSMLLVVRGGKFGRLQLVEAAMPVRAVEMVREDL